MAGFVPTEKYANMTPWENEIGKVEEVRYLWSTIFESWPDAGGAPGSTVISNGGSAADVYPILYIAKDAYGIVPLKGQEAITPMVVNPKPSDSDPLAQRGHVAWKSMQAAVILQDLWMVRAEVAASV
jgi:N4-gp56 family major capsid protein